MASAELIDTCDESLGSWHQDIRQQRETASSHKLLRGSEFAGSQTRALQETGDPDGGLNVQYPCKHLVNLDLILLPVAVDEQHAHNPHTPSIERNLVLREDCSWLTAELESDSIETETSAMKCDWFKTLTYFKESLAKYYRV